MQSLISDTISYLRQEGHLTTKREKTKPPTLPPMKKEVVKEEAPIIVAPAPPAPKKAPLPMGFQTIQKHLPHLKLIEEVPQPKTLAIVVTEEAELPFLKNLARAIQDRLCPVKLLPKTAPLAGYFLILTQEPNSACKDRQLLMLQSSEYEADPEKKKALWTRLCQLLKSS